MANITTRSSVLALKVETTEGVPALPTAGTDAVALQDDLSIEPAFDELENAERRNSIGPAKTIQGAENPTVSFSHYLRSSGVEGQEPNYGDLLHAFMGAKSTTSTEYDTVSGSTVSVINVGAGEGATFERGEGLLIKDGVNGYRVRAIDSISTDALTMGFNVPVAPASAVLLGECQLYKPATEGHPTLTASVYLGNGGAVQMVSGCRVTGLTMDFNAGELNNANYSLEGIKFYFNPIEITSSTRYLDFTDSSGAKSAVVAVKVYSDPHDLAAALQTAIRAVGNSGQVFTVTYSDTTGRFRIEVDTGTLELDWNTGANTANTIGPKIGFLVAADDTGALFYVADNALNLAFPYTAAYDNIDPTVGKNMEVMMGDATDYVCFDASAVSISGTNERAVLGSLCAESGRSGSLITSRTVEITVTARLSRYDADVWRRFREGSDTKFQVTFGQKSGGNWIPGKVGYAYSPTCSVTSFSVSDEDGLAVANIGLRCFVNSSGQGEFYIGTL
jgi:hypothetical protein